MVKRAVSLVRVRSAALVAGAACALVLAGLAPVAQAGAPVAVIVQSTVDTAAAARAVEAVGGRVTVALPIVSGVSALVPATRLGALAARREIRAVTSNHPVVFAETTSTTNVSTVNHVYPREIGADRLWKEGVDGRPISPDDRIRVALIDTGITPVPDLQGRIVPVPDPTTKGGGQVPCVNFSGEPTCDDSYGHGTFMAGLIAGDGKESGGVYKGVAPRAELVSVKIAGRDGSADVTKVLAAIQWVVSFAHELDIRVLNLSLGTNSTASWRIDPLNHAVQRAWHRGIVVVVAASNRGPNTGTISKPADDPYVITAAAVDDRETPAIDDDRLPFFSGRGPAFAGTVLEHAKPDVVAPGGRVISLRAKGSLIDQRVPSTFPSSAYRRGSGTSMSAAIVSGAAALVLQANPTWSPNRVKFALMSTARKVAERDRNGVGSGLIEAYVAARQAPAGEANTAVDGRSSGQGSLDGSRGDVIVSLHCPMLEQSLHPECQKLHGGSTAQLKQWDSGEYTTPGTWTSESWYSSQWVVGLSGSSWYGSSWYGCPPQPDPTNPDHVRACWYGSSWYGSSWYGSTDSTAYGTSLLGSSWYGAWG